MQTPKGYVSDELIAFIQNEGNANAMSNLKTPEECYDLVKDKTDVTLEEFCEQMAIIKDFLEEKKSGLLSEEDLDAIAGGKSTGGTVLSIASAGAIIGSAIAAAAGS